MDDLGQWLGGTVTGALISAIGYLIYRIYKGRGDYAEKIAQAEATKTEAEAAAKVTEAAAKVTTAEASVITAEIEDRRETHTNKEFRSLLAIQRKERQEDRELIHQLRNDVHALTMKVGACEVEKAIAKERHENAERRIAHLEKALRDAGINFNEGSAPHKSLPSQEAK